MSTSPSQNGVRYDDKNNCYIIKIDGIEYVALYREEIINKNCDNKELVEELDELVQISNNKNEIARKRIEDEKKALEEYDRIIKNGGFCWVHGNETFYSYFVHILPLECS